MIEFVKIKNLKPGDRLAKTVYNDRLQLLLKAGNVLTIKSIQTISELGYKGCYVEHNEEFRREDVPLAEPLLDDMEEIAVIRKLQALFSSAEAFYDPMNIEFQRRRNDIEASVSELTDKISSLYHKGEFLYEVEDYVRTSHNWIFHHSLNTCIVSIGIAFNLGLSREEAGEIGVGAIYHDYGKVYFGPELYNREELSEEGKTLLKQHPEKMFRVLQALRYPVNTSYAVWQHHEKADGTGYPNGLDIGKITLPAQIVSLASAFDNLINIQVYNKEPMDQKDALEYLQGCNLYSVDCMRAMFRFIVPYPVGSGVLLSTGQKGVVLKNVPGMVLRPYVLVGRDLYDLAHEPRCMNVTIMERIK